MNSKFSHISLYTLLAISCSTSFFSISAKMNDNQYATNPQEQERLNLYAPIVPSSSGMRTFFERTFNRPEYEQDVLPQDFSHFIQCMRYVFNKYKTRTHGELVLSLFDGKMLDCPCINAAAFSQMLDNLTPILNNYFHDAEEKALTCWQTAIDKMLCDAFMKHFALFKKQPLDFLHELSGSITNTLYDQEEILNDISIQEFRTAIAEFINLGLSKLAWHPEDGIQTWKLTEKTLSYQLHQLAADNIITDKQLKRMYVTLTKRYSFFIELCGENLPLSFFDEIKRELAAHNFELIDCGELENCIETKRQRLARSLLQAEAKVRTANATV